jgi:hypothetical protein
MRSVATSEDGSLLGDSRLKTNYTVLYCTVCRLTIPQEECLLQHVVEFDDLISRTYLRRSRVDAHLTPPIKRGVMSAQTISDAGSGKKSRAARAICGYSP